MASKPTSSRNPPTNLSDVRRTLFNHTLTRRPTTSSKTIVPSSSQREESKIHDDSDDIVVRDRNGNFQVVVPTLPPLEDEQAQEEEDARDTESAFCDAFWATPRSFWIKD